MACKATQAPCFPLHSALTNVYKLMTSLARAACRASGPIDKPKSQLSRSGAEREVGGVVLTRLRTVDGDDSLFASFHSTLQSGGSGDLSALLLLSAPPLASSPYTPPPTRRPAGLLTDSCRRAGSARRLLLARVPRR